MCLILFLRAAQFHPPPPPPPPVAQWVTLYTLFSRRYSSLIVLCMWFLYFHCSLSVGVQYKSCRGLHVAVMDALQGLREVWECEGRRTVVSFRSPLDVWADNPTFLCAEVVFICWGLLTLRHGNM